jgi:hypothetical protein
VKCTALGLCKVASVSDRAVLHFTDKGKWMSAGTAASAGTKSGRASTRRVAPLMAVGTHAPIVVPRHCTVIVPTVAGVKELLTEALHTELVKVVTGGSEKFDKAHLLRFVQGEATEAGCASAAVGGPLVTCCVRTFARMPVAGHAPLYVSMCVTRTYCCFVQRSPPLVVVVVLVVLVVLVGALRRTLCVPSFGTTIWMRTLTLSLLMGSTL